MYSGLRWQRRQILLKKYLIHISKKRKVKSSKVCECYIEIQLLSWYTFCACVVLLLATTTKCSVYQYNEEIQSVSWYTFCACVVLLVALACAGKWLHTTVIKYFIYQCNDETQFVSRYMFSACAVLLLALACAGQ